jgi:hypothetical protein
MSRGMPELRVERLVTPAKPSRTRLMNPTEVFVRERHITHTVRHQAEY